MSHYRRVLLLTLLVFLGWNEADLSAQGLGNSPYSSLGLGEFYGDAYSDNSGSGGAGVSTGGGFQVNNLNPALWVRNRFTTLDFGMVGQYRTITSGRENQGNAGGNLSYVSLSFPVNPKWVIGAGLKPYSFIDYANESFRPVNGTPGTARYITSGKGGINKASITNSYQVNRYLSLGLEASYFFGNVRRASEVTLSFPGAEAVDPSETGEYIVSLSERSTYSDFGFRAGAALRIPLKKDNKMNLNLGGAYSFRNRLNATKTTSFELTQNTFPVIPPDTLENDLSGSLTVPQQYQVGASLEWPFKLILSADYSHQSWTQFRNFDNSAESLKDVHRVHLGAEYTPKFASLNYFDNVRYRLGFSYGNTPYVINGRAVNDANVSLGFTFPMGRGYQNFLSIALIGGQRGSSASGQIKERYGRMVVGITLLEKWFQKQKLD